MKRPGAYVLPVVIFLFIPLSSVFSDSLQDGIALHNKAYGDRRYVAEAQRELKKLADIYPLAKAYYGNAVSMEAQELSKKNIFKALSLLKDGIRIMDEAVREDPDNKTIRMLRLLNSSVVDENSPINRRKALGEDVAWFHSAHPAMTDLSQALICLHEGKYWLREKNKANARAAFNRCISLAPNSEIGKSAREYIKKL
jgi:tetratricopeptide (TPR) repeat protein